MLFQPTVSIVATPEISELAKSVHAILRSRAFDVRDSVIPVDTKRFADGNSLPRVTESVRRTEVYFFYAMPLGRPEEGMARFSHILNAIHLADPIRIKVVMPYFEGRQDRKDGPRTPITAKVMARAIEGEETVRGFITFDLHADQLVLAFEYAVENLWGQKILAQYARVHYKDKGLVGIVAPDVGSAKRADKFAKKSGFPLLGIMKKTRGEANNISCMRYIGDIPLSGYHIILPDDLIDTGGTMLHASEKILSGGALSCTAFPTHWLASPKGNPNDPLFTAEEKFRKAGLRVVTTNTIPRTPEYLSVNADFLTIVPCDELLANVIASSLIPGDSASKHSE